MILNIPKSIQNENLLGLKSVRIVLIVNSELAPFRKFQGAESANNVLYRHEYLKGLERRGNLHLDRTTS